MIRNEDDPFWAEYWQSIEFDEGWQEIGATTDRPTPRWARWAWNAIDRIGRIKMIGMGQHGIIQRERDC